MRLMPRLSPPCSPPSPSGSASPSQRAGAAGADAGELRLSYAPVVQRVAPAVVNVYAAKVVQNRNPLFEDPIFRRFFGVPGERRAARCSARSAPA